MSLDVMDVTFGGPRVLTIHGSCVLKSTPVVDKLESRAIRDRTLFLIEEPLVQCREFEPDRANKCPFSTFGIVQKTQLESAFDRSGMLTYMSE